MKKMKLVNLTPHAINVVDADGNELLTIEPAGGLARVMQEVRDLMTAMVDDIAVPITYNTYGDIEGLPAPQEDTCYIVSAMVAQAARGQRNDLLVPNESVRDESGRIIGCKSLAKVF